jgi:hypothetical protein
MGEVAWCCMYCLETLIGVKKLNAHILSEHVKHVFKCERCSFSTTEERVMNTHIESKHACKFACTRKDSLGRHVLAENLLYPTPNFNWVEDIEWEEEQKQDSEKIWNGSKLDVSGLINESERKREKMREKGREKYRKYLSNMKFQEHV